MTGCRAAANAVELDKSREIKKAKQPLESTLSSASDLNRRERLLTVRDAADLLRLSSSWLAKARMQGDGPPFVKFGRSIRYAEETLVQWTKAHLRQSTNEK